MKGRPKTLSKTPNNAVAENNIYGLVEYSGIYDFQTLQSRSDDSLLTLRLLMSHTHIYIYMYIYMYIYICICIYIYIYMEHLFLMFLDHTQRRSTVGRTPLDE